MKKGNRAGARAARALIEKYGDVVLPSSGPQALLREPLTLRSTEASGTAKEFSAEAREGLERRGFAIYSLTGQSMQSLRDAGGKIEFHWESSYPEVVSLPSMHSEVALDPNQIILPNSNNKSLKDQHELVRDYSLGLWRDVRDVKAIIGQVPDYLDLTFAYLERTLSSLRGEDSGIAVRTATPTDNEHTVVIGGPRDDGTLSATPWYDSAKYEFAHVIPLVVPA